MQFIFLSVFSDSFVNSQEWTLSRAVPDLKLVYCEFLMGVVNEYCTFCLLLKNHYNKLYASCFTLRER